MRKTLFDHINRFDRAVYLELLQAFVARSSMILNVQKRKADEATAAVAAIEEQRKQTIEEFRRERYGDLVEAARKAKTLSEDVVRAEHRAALQDLTSPVDGTVQQLAVHTIGGVDHHRRKV